MHFHCAVAVHTSHPALPEVKIGLDAFILAHVLISHPAAVAGSAVAGQRGSFIEHVAFDEATTY